MHRASILLVAAITLPACADRETATMPSSEAGDAAAIHAAALTLDTHVDIDLDFATEAIDPLDADIQVNLQKMRAGGLDTAFFVVYVGQTERTRENYARAQADAMTKFEAIHRMTNTLYPDLIGLAYRAADVERLVSEGKLAAAIGVENGYAIGTDLGLIDRYYELGARYLGLVHNGHNDLADSASPRPRFGDAEIEHGGVSELGAAAIRRMNELGIMVDISHASKQTALDTIALSQAPVIASHSSVHALGNHVRNLDDETLLRLRDNGGVVQIVAFDIYINVRPAEFFEARGALRESLGLQGFVDPAQLDEDIREAYERGMAEIDARWSPADVAAFVDHIDYVVDLIGIDHVGISSDFGGGGGINGWSDAAETPNVTAELLARGYSAEDIEKIWSGNLLRVWREVEAVAARL
ncbi:MAG: dipeptidase [Gammaproteobacteria bacterium]|nr:dipeptidase [Gammaproteobacteria bacterium]